VDQFIREVDTKVLLIVESNRTIPIYSFKNIDFNKNIYLKIAVYIQAGIRDILGLIVQVN